MSALARSYKMENIKELIVETPNGESVTHIIIDHGNEQFTSMLKSTYDAQLEAAKNGNLI
jgi:hypothetical protein